MEEAQAPPPVRPVARETKLDETTKERLRTLLVQFVLDARAAYLGTGTANVMKHWSILQSRMVSAIRRTCTADEWVSETLKGLGVVSMNSSLSSSLLALTSFVRERDCLADFTVVIERETALVMAMAKKSAEEAADERDEKKAAAEAAGMTAPEKAPRRARKA